MVARMSGLSERVLGGLRQSGPGYARRPLPWCGVAVEDLRQEGAGTVFWVTCMPRGCVSGKAGSIEH